MRFAAFVIDSMIAGLMVGIVKIPFSIAAMSGADFLKGNFIFHYSLLDVLGYVGVAVYFVLLTYYTHSTLGKKLFRLEVVSPDKEWTFLNILYRETVGRFLSSLLFVGYLAIPVQKKKQGFHDMLCDTYVVYKNMRMMSVTARPEEDVYGTATARPEEDVYGTVTAGPGEEVYETVATRPEEEVYGTVTARPAEDVYGTVTARPKEDVYETVTTGPEEDVYGTATARPAEEVYETVTARPEEEVYETVATRPEEEVYGTVTDLPTEESMDEVSQKENIFPETNDLQQQEVIHVAEQEQEPEEFFFDKI